VFVEEESTQCRFGTPIVDGDQAAVHWSAQTRLADGGTEHLAGVSLLRFSEDGLVLEERDFWNQS
jgi:SnoaL-like domain